MCVVSAPEKGLNKGGREIEISILVLFLLKSPKEKRSYVALFCGCLDYVLTCFYIKQNGWIKAAVVEESAISIKQNQSLQNDYCDPAGGNWLLFPLPYLKPCQRSICSVVDIGHLWDMVCGFLDFGSISKVVAYQSWDLPGSIVPQVSYSFYMSHPTCVPFRILFAKYIALHWKDYVRAGLTGPIQGLRLCKDAVVFGGPLIPVKPVLGLQIDLYQLKDEKHHNSCQCWNWSHLFFIL